jgi:hypothetical protein
MRGPLLKWEGGPVDLQNLEAVVRRLFSDAEFRATAIANPSSALAAYDLGSDDRLALTKLCAELANGDDVREPHERYWL